MKQKIKKFFSENKETIVTSVTGFVVGTIGTALVAQAVMNGRRVESIWTLEDRETGDKKGYLAIQKNGTELPFMIPLPTE